MQQLFAVTVQWRTKGNPNAESVVLNVVAETASEATGAAVRRELEGFEDSLDFCRFTKVEPIADVDLILEEE